MYLVRLHSQNNAMDSNNHSVMSQVFYCRLEHLKMSPSLTMFTQLRTLCTGNYAPAVFETQSISSVILTVLY